jgi:N-acyl homoserine lactone hydrolase
MTVRAHPRPLELPLPGGSDGATVTVESFVTGTFRSPEIFHSSPDGEIGLLKLIRATRMDNRPVPIPAFLVRHPTAGEILIDTGLHPSIASRPEENLGRTSLPLLKPEMEPGQDLASQLREKGVDPAGIRLVILTHLHVDHASAVSEFPNATFLVTAREWTAATTGILPVLKGYRRAQFDYGFDFRAVDFGVDEVSSHSTFGRTLDLFGDGSVRLVFTPGHSDGHQSVLLRLPEREMLVSGDAIFLAEQLDEGTPLAGRTADRHEYERSLSEIRLFRRQNPSAVITPGHDRDFYESAPEQFD